MTASYGSMFVFGILLLASWAGWGAAVERVVLGRSQSDRALQAGWGLAFTVLLGGVLNLAAVISPLGLLAFLAGGLALLARDAWGRRRQSSVRGGMQRLRRRPALALAAAAVGGMLFTAYAAKVCSKDYNGHDDLQAYFVFPAKMVQTGAMGPDPFSEARMLSLGGMSFLQAIVLSVADPRYYRLLEPAVPLLLAAALLLGVARDARAGPWSGLLGVFLLLAVPPPAVNAASLVTGLALFLTLFRTLWQVASKDEPDPRGAVVVALVASALCSLKTTHIPACALMVVLAYLARGQQARPRRAVAGELLLAGGLTLLFLAPWMLASYRSNGTLLFPFLGRGFHGSAYGGDWGPYQGLTAAAATQRLWAAASDLRVVPLWILSGGLLIQGAARAARGSLAAFTLSAIVSFLAMAGSHHVDAVHRYSWAIAWAVVLTLVIHAWGAARTAGGSAWRLSAGTAAALLAVGTLAFAHGGEARRYWKSRPQAIEIAVMQARSPGFKRGAAWNGARMQEAAPQGAVLLTRLRYPFVLDFTRQTVLIANYPGGSSPPPGLPSFQGPEPVARYLCAHSVRYVAYSYRKEANFSRKDYGDRLARGALPWNRAQARHALDFQDNLVALGSSRRRVFDDGDVFVLDLAISSDGRHLGCPSS